MDQEKLKRRQSLKLIISEAIMVLAVIATVTVLALLVSGYWVNSNFEIERNGLLQVSSTPTGARVAIDGDSPWFQRTNTSKVLSSGEHSVLISRDGYDTWEKTINIREGLLYRLPYPRLFLENRTIENVYDATGATFATFSPAGDTLLLANETSRWTIINVDSDTIEPKKLDISKSFSSISLAEDAAVGVFTGKILTADWSQDGTRVLVNATTDSGSEWVLLDTKNPTNSVNLTREFSSNLISVQIFDHSANTLLALKDGSLRKIDIPGKSISAVLASDVIDFDFYGNEIIFVSKTTADPVTSYDINLMKIGDKEATVLDTLITPAKVTLSRFYDDKYISVLAGETLSLYKKDSFAPVSDFNLTFAPAKIKVGTNGEFIFTNTGTSFAVLDMEAMAISEWQAEGSQYGWLDSYMVYTVSNGELIVYDFDGLNRRTLAQNISTRFPATITSDKWLYYFSDDNLVREWLITR